MKAFQSVANQQFDMFEVFKHKYLNEPTFSILLISSCANSHTIFNLITQFPCHLLIECAFIL